MSGPMNLQYCSVGGDTNAWGTKLNNLLSLVENHSHEPGKGVQVPTAGLNVNADLTFNTFGAIALKLAGFAPVAPSSVTSYANALFVSSADNNLWWRNASGTDVMLTDGDALNVNAFTGGIGGDYGGAGALLSYDDPNHRYLFQQEGSPRPWAGAAMGNLDIYEEAASIGNFVRIQSPHALAASYTMTWLTGLPAAQSLLQVGADGTLSASNTIVGHISHGNQTISGYPNPQLASVVGVTVTVSGGLPGATWPSSSDAYMPLLVLPSGAELQKIVLNTGTSGAGTITFALYRMLTIGALVAVDGASSTSHANPVTLTPTSPAVLSDGEVYWLRITADASSSTIFYSYTITYSVP